MLKSVTFWWFVALFYIVFHPHLNAQEEANIGASSSVPYINYNYVIIANVDTELALSVTEMQRIFTGRTRFLPSGEAVFPVLQKQMSDSHQGFLNERLQLFPYQVERIWETRIYSGRVNAPVILSSDESVIAFVRANKGAVGYIRKPQTPINESLQLYVWNDNNKSWFPEFGVPQFGVPQ